MTVEETAKIMDVLKTFFPQFYSKISSVEKLYAAQLWTAMFSEEGFEIVLSAVKAFVASDTKGFPPSVGQIKQKIRQITQPQALDEGEAWGMVQRAVANANYHAKEEFESLPLAVRSAIGSESVLRQWALVEIETLETVVHSNFLRSFRARIQSEAEYRALPSEIRQELAQIGAGVFNQLVG